MRRAKISPDRVLQALGDPTRRAILDKLSQRPHSVSRLAEPLGVSLTAISQHLQVLEECGLVRTEKQGRVRTAMLAAEGFDVIETWIKQRRRLIENQLDQLAALLDEDDDPTI